MIEKRSCINVWSDMNTWIDFCILVDEQVSEKAQRIIEKAYEDWWELPDEIFASNLDNNPSKTPFC